MRDHRRESETVGENLAYLRDKKGELTESRIKCMQQVTKDHLYHLFGVLDYYVTYWKRVVSVYGGQQLGNWSF